MNPNEIYDILEEKINEGDAYEEFKLKTSSNENEYGNFLKYYKDFMQNMVFQLNLYQLSSFEQADILYENISPRIIKNSEQFNENYLSFILRSISKILNMHPSKYDLFANLLFQILETYDKNDEFIHKILLHNINNFQLFRELFERNFLTIDFIQKNIHQNNILNYFRKKNLLFYLVYLRDKLENDEFDKFVQSLVNTGSQYVRKKINKVSKMNKNEIELIKTQRENQNQIAIIIRNDDYNKFLEIINLLSISIDSNIPKSKNEMNKLFKKPTKSSYVNYSAYYGSIKIFRYLISCKAKIDSDTLKCACAGGNSEVIRILYQNKIFI